MKQVAGENLVVKLSDSGWYMTSSSPVPLKNHRVRKRCTLNLPRDQTSFHWCGVVVSRGGCQLKCHPRHLAMVQNDEKIEKPSCS
ncbi:uncharacterized protein TNCV_1085031 [Trichonephila clavipes]|nr:uncharacterized protein TNCV_1085031 [Trichonephila clavipes]